MASKYEQAAGIVHSWVMTYGNADMKSVTDDLVEVLRICHERAGKSTSIELADAIADFVIDLYTTPASFDTPAEPPRGQPAVDPENPPNRPTQAQLDFPDGGEPGR